MSTSQDEQTQQRQANLDALTALGVAAYPNRFDRRDTISALVDAHSPKAGEVLEAERPDTTTSGRILGIRSFGKANFLVISDGRQKLQVYIRQDSMPELDFKIFTSIDCVDRLLLAENDPRFELVYFAYSVSRKEHVRVKVRVSDSHGSAKADEGMRVEAAPTSVMCPTSVTVPA